jgi:citrate lyase subunit beta / citryl-CoA lyase
MSRTRREKGVKTMTETMPPRLRSALYLPASNAKAIAKARTLPCDMVILDLEDAVSPEAKDAAREAAVSAVREGGFGERRLLVRTNGPETEWWEADVAALAALDIALLLPKVSSAAMLEACAAHLPGRDLWAMIETPSAILAIADICASAARLPLRGIVIGTNDLAKDMGCRLGRSRRPIEGALTLSVCAARANGIAALDGVFNDLDDEDGFEREASEGADFGFDGKTLIHPNQIEPCNRAFSPSEDEIAWARRIVEAFRAPENAGRNAIKVDGRMVERLHLVGAGRVLARA